MPNPISRKQFDAAARLYSPDVLHEKLTDKQVAERAGVSESTARNIRLGELQRPPAEQRVVVKKAKPKRKKPRTHDGIEFKIVEPYRCPGCHHEITLQPCLICHERAKRQRKL